jgi:hypothetical protein
MGEGGVRRREPRIWSQELREHFLGVLRETGNAEAAYRAVGHEQMFRKRRRWDRAFAADWSAAVAAAEARLKGCEAAFIEEAAPGAARDPEQALRPGGRIAASGREVAIRRSSKGRVQLARVKPGQWTRATEADFLARLRATGNLSGSARAVGFTKSAVFQRLRKWPAFARACDAALEEASVRFDYSLVAYAHKLLRTADADDVEEAEDVEDAAGEAGEAVPFDPMLAMRILTFIDARRSGRTARGRRRGPPERSFEEACESILAKIAAIERHEAMVKEGNPGQADG